MKHFFFNLKEKLRRLKKIRKNAYLNIENLSTRGLHSDSERQNHPSQTSDNECAPSL